MVPPKQSVLPLVKGLIFLAAALVTLVIAVIFLLNGLFDLLVELTGSEWGAAFIVGGAALIVTIILFVTATLINKKK